MHHHPMGPNQVIAERVMQILSDPNASSRSPEEWIKLRRPAFETGNLIEATAVTCAQYKVLSGNLDAVDARVLELLATPGMLSWTDTQWRDKRSAAWTAGDLKEVAALTYACYLVNYRQQRHNIPGYQPRNHDHIEHHDDQYHTH